MSIWIWGTSETAWIEDWLVHLPTGATIVIDTTTSPGPVIALGVLGQSDDFTHLYWARDISDARAYMDKLGSILGAVRVVSHERRRVPSPGPRNVA